MRRPLFMGRGSILLLFTAFVASTALAKWARLEDVPVERLLQNVLEQLKSKPKDAQLHYLAGRLYSLKFAQVKDVMKSYDSDSFADYEQIQTPRMNPTPLTTKELSLLERSRSHYYRSLTLDKKNQRTKLGLAWVTEESIPYASKIKKLPWTSAKPTASLLRKAALQWYREVYAAEKAVDLSDTGLSRDANRFLSVEAGHAILRLIGSTTNENELKEIVEIRAHEKAVYNVPRPVTPIIFPLTSGPGFPDLVDNSARVKFDLAGNDLKRSWPWITPKAAFLVWDPGETGKITSGRQLFGSATFWMFFRDGYEALASLDDDRNGWLEGRELRGISSWQDANANATSDPGEVVPVATLGVAAIRVKAEGSIGDMPFQSTGIKWKDGRVSPTYDWVPVSK